MADEKKEFFADYETGIAEGHDQDSSSMDPEREYPIETRCCVSGDEVKHSFCRYPDPTMGTMMVMSRDVMLRYTQAGGNLAGHFERVLELRRAKEKRKR